MPTVCKKPLTSALNATGKKARETARNVQASRVLFPSLMLKHTCQPRIPNCHALFATRGLQSSAIQAESGLPV
jgi:hypothetical protein